MDEALGDVLLADLKLDVVNTAGDTITALVDRLPARVVLPRGEDCVDQHADQPAGDIHILAAIAARDWEVLKDEGLAQRFVEALAQNSLGPDAFAQVMGDLLTIPGMRPPLLAQLRNPERSASLNTAVGHMFGQNF